MTTGRQHEELARELGRATSGDVMRAVVQHRYGPAEVLHVEAVPRPVPADDEVLVRVRAASLSRGSWHLMSGKPYVMRLGLGFRRPKNAVIGQDLAGTVVAVGSAITHLEPGDDVFGVGRGSFAEYAVARADQLSRKPAEVSFEQAAAVPVSGTTALQALRDVGHVAPGQHVLIIGASGGVGTFAVQLAKAFGAHVTAVCSTAKVELVRSIGADQVVDYSTTDFSDTSDRYDVILDIGGNASLRRLRHALSPHGTLVIVGGEDGGDWVGMGRQLHAVALSPFTRQRLAMFIATQKTRDLEQLAELIDTGAVVPVIDRSFALNQLPEAMRHLETGGARGKIAITI